MFAAIEFEKELLEKLDPYTKTYETPKTKTSYNKPTKDTDLDDSTKNTELIQNTEAKKHTIQKPFVKNTQHLEKKIPAGTFLFLGICIGVGLSSHALVTKLI